MHNHEEKTSGDMIQALRDGDRQVLRAVFMRYHRSIYRFLWLRLRSAPEAEELAQEVFMRFWETRAHLSRKSHIEQQLYRLALAALSETSPQFDDWNSELLLADHAQKPAFTRWSTPDRHALLLHEPLRTVLFLRRYENKTYHEIAAIIRTTRRGIEKMLCQALRYLEETTSPPREHKAHGWRRLFRSEPADIHQLFLYWQEGRLSHRQEKRLKRWLKETANRQRWQRLQSLWTDLRCPPVQEATPVSVQWLRFENRLVDDLAADLATEKKQPIRSVHQSFIYVLAAAVLLIVLFGFMARQWLLAPHLTSVIVKPGEQQTVLLPDYSRAELNSASSLQYPENLATDFRQLFLTGEAYFTVSPSQLPFEVRTDAGLIRSQGAAEFNLRARSGKAELYVQSGELIIFPSAAPASHADTLTARQWARFSAREVSILPNAQPERILAWRKGELYFEDTPVREALADLGRHYGKIFYIASELDSLRVSAHIRGKSAEEACAVLAEKLGLSWWKTRYGYAIGRR